MLCHMSEYIYCTYIYICNIYIYIHASIYGRNFKIYMLCYVTRLNVYVMHFIIYVREIDNIYMLCHVSKYIYICVCAS